MPTSFETSLGGDAPDTTATGFVLAVGGWAHGSIGVTGDADFIAIDLVAGQSYSFAMVGIGSNALTNPYLRLYGTDGTTLLGEDDDSLANGNAVLRFTALDSGRYYLQASAVGAITGNYAVAATIGAQAQFDAAMITGIIDSHASWAAQRGTAVTLSYGFSETVDHGLPGFSQFTPAQMELTRSLLAMFAEVAGLTFVEQNPGGQTDQATLLYGNFSAGDGAVSWAGAPGDPGFGQMAGDVFINTHAYTPPSELPTPGSIDALMMMQLIGESLGLAAPGLYTAPGPISHATHADFVQDSQQFTVMSPFGAENTGATALRPDTLGIHDIQALQLIYGANSATRAGHDTYGFGATAGPVYDFDLNLDPMVTIWDGGGTDTLDLSRYSAAQTVSLIAGSHSSVGGFSGNLGIAFGTVIEHAIGGRGADEIIGNTAANHLRGGAGRDTLSGGNGHDTLEGGAGSDTLFGGAGNDLIIGDAPGPAPPPPASFAVVATNPDTSASLGATGIDLFLLPSFTLELIWRQNALDAPGPVARFGNLVLHRHADGSGSVEFEGAEIDSFIGSILPATLFDGTAHRLTLSYDDMEGRLAVWLDGVRVAERLFVPGTRNLLTQGDVELTDHARFGDIRLFDLARSASDIWDMAWAPLPDPATTSGLIYNWRGDGTGALVNHLPSLPPLSPQGPVSTGTISFETASSGNLMAGGSGNDTYHVHHLADAVIEGAGDGLDQVIAATGWVLGAGQSVEILTVAAGSGGIALGGNELANRLVSAATHADTLTGGAGNDTYAVYHSGDRVIEAASGGTDRIDAYANHTLYANSSVEFLYAMGSAGRALTGNALANRFISNAAHADTLTGGAGNDTYSVYHSGDRVIEAASGGHDRIYSHVHYTLSSTAWIEELRAAVNTGLRLTGNGMNNLIQGGTGRDTLEGGGGFDRLYGGADLQRDSFVFRTIADSAVGTNRDTIYQFLSGIDLIDLRLIDANSTQAGNQAFAFSTDGPRAYGLWTVSSSSGLVLRLDTTGDARADSEIRLFGIHSVQLSDFLL